MFFIVGADIFHEDIIYRTGINDKLKHLTLALNEPNSSVGQHSTLVNFRHTKVTTNEPRFQHQKQFEC